jgi:hypothetical protein
MIKQTVVWVGLALMAYFAYLVWFPPKKTAIDYDRDAIDYCWKEYERKSLSPDMKLLVAKSCEDREEKFLKDYNRKP